MADQSPTTKPAPIAPGQRYGRLVAIEFVDRDQYGHQRWKFLCDCGREKVILASRVCAGRTKACGCLMGTQTKHGRWNTTEYRIWLGMGTRCNNPKDHMYVYYGARGIAICERWQKFENFYADVGSRPSPSHSIDRIDNDGNYEPGNVRWATKSQQALNRRKPRRRKICPDESR